MYLDNLDIELLDDDFERMAPLLDLSWSTDEPLEFDTLPRPFDAWRDKFKDRGAITAARKQGYRSIAIAGHRLPFGVERIWRHLDYAERMRSIVISSQKWMEIYLGVDIEIQPLIVKALEGLPPLLVKEQYTPSMILGCSASLHTLLDFVGLVVLDPKERKLAIQQAYDEVDAQAEERFLLDAIETANESLPGRAQILRLPSLLRHDTRQLALDPKSLIEHRRAHQCAHLRAVLLKGRHGTTTSTSQVSDPTSKAKLSEHGEMHSSVLRGFVRSMGAARLETVSGVARSLRWTEQGTFSRFSTANETDNIGYIEDGRKEVRMQLRARQYMVFAKIPTFGSIEGNVTSAMPLKIGSLVCFGLKRGIIPGSCDASNIGEEQLSIGLVRYMYAKTTSNHCDRAETDSLPLLSNVVLQEWRVDSVAYLGERVFDLSQQAEARFCFLRRCNGLRNASVSLNNQMKGVKDVGSKRKAASAGEEPSAKQNRTG
ncbi:BQ5605_C026g10247 [Microbotryum silenes-dioicae]|uniref:BQ5605_C026g10247 protein n=1 Tax=Microbotryum silenes-dioicae TaxID=796604 RepID=A0A2X0MMZ5_9BASI|nr:BQ5605_C026g10247 [Microbotryum silenes-dioicae]